MAELSRLLTFLHGIEPRAWVFLHVHCDDPARADALFRDTLAEFAVASASEPLARWPMRFWTILLAQPGLTAPDANVGEAGLARMAPGPRAVFLLPMVAGLDEGHASEALGISSQALARALVQARMAWPDSNGHERLRSLLQARIRQPTESDRKAMAALRTEALGIEAAPIVAPPIAPAARSRTARWTILALLGAALLAASAWWLLPRVHLPARAVAGRSEALPPEPLPPPPALDDATIVTHPDYLVLAAPDEVAIARDLALLSWFDADSPAADSAVAPTVVDLPAVDDFATLPDAQRALLMPASATWPDLDADTRQRLQAQAADWLRHAPAEQAALRDRMRAWDRLPIAERARRRAPFDAWLQLSEGDRQRLRRTARRWSALPAAQQADARARFDALAADAQRLWWLGPTLGQELATTAARWAFLPATERDEFLATLRGLDGSGRADFIALYENLPPEQRARLRQDLLAQPPAQRDAWLRARRAQ